MEAITREEKIISGENLTPITRKEMFLAKASGQNIETPTPITREEYFLSKIIGGGGTAPVEGTAIPVGVPVEKIYINLNNTLEQTKEYLSRLTYIQTPFFDVPICPIFVYMGDSINGVFLFAIQYNNDSNDYGIGAVSSLQQEGYLGLYCGLKEEQYNRHEGIIGSNFSTAGITYYLKGFYIDTLGAISLTDLNGIPIGLENEKIKNVLSITPFTA